MKSILFIPLFIFFTVSQFLVANAKKKDYLPGHIVTIKEDTIKGFIKKSKFSDLRKIYFKDNEGNTKVLTADSISGFVIGLEKYIVVNSDDLAYSDNVEKNKRVFLLELVKGQVSLYSYSFCYRLESYGRKWTDKKSYISECRDYQYLKKNDDPFVVGYIKKNTAIKIGIKTKKPVDNFTLAAYFDDYEDLSKKFLYKIYKESQIQMAVEEYNKWYSEKQ